jgi:TetR/AcrR family transcriptional regulator, fatty acid metabolism regulator protein
MLEKKNQKREMIVDAAIKVFAEKGYHSSRTLDISKEAGVAYGSLYQYFKSKDDILLYMFQKTWKDLVKRMEKIDKTIDSSEDKLLAIFDMIFRSYRNKPDLMKVLIMDVPRLSQFYSTENQKLYHSFFVNLAKVFLEGQIKGAFRGDISPMIAAFVIYGAVDTTIRQYVYNPEFKYENFPLEEAKNQIMKLLNTVYSGKAKVEKAINQ